MIDFLAGKASDQRLRLFAVACCRRGRDSDWHYPEARRFVDVAEQFALGLASDAERKVAASEAQGEAVSRVGGPFGKELFDQAEAALDQSALVAAKDAAMLGY